MHRTNSWTHYGDGLYLSATDDGLLLDLYERETETDRQTDRQTDGQTERHRQTNRQTNRKEGKGPGERD